MTGTINAPPDECKTASGDFVVWNFDRSILLGFGADFVNTIDYFGKTSTTYKGNQSTHYSVIARFLSYVSMVAILNYL